MPFWGLRAERRERTGSDQLTASGRADYLMGLVDFVARVVDARRSALHTLPMTTTKQEQQQEERHH